MKWLLVGLLCGSVQVMLAQPTQVWMYTYDDSVRTNGISSVVIEPDSGYVFINVTFLSNPGRSTWTRVSADGVLDSSVLLRDSIGGFQGGGSHSVERRDDGSLWFAGGRVYFTGTQPDGQLICFDEHGDTLWTRRYGGPGFEALNGVALTSDGGALAAGVRQTTQSDAYAVRVDANGDTLWTRTYGGPNTTENAFCARPTPDGGFILSGYQVLPGNDYEMLLLKLDSAGNLEWQEHYGSPWVDNAAFVEVLPQGGYIMAGGERISAGQERFPVLYRLEEDGSVVWSQNYEDSTLFVFFSVPVLMSDGGYAISGGGYDWDNDNRTGILMRTDSLGNTLWKRSYSTNAVRDHYIYDLRRTLDGGFIMAGTAWDSLLVSQDAWLIKTDSFGCLVPGCQIFDGLQEQLTDLSASLAIYPNPAQDHVNVRLELPATLRVQGPLRLAVTSLDGRLVHERLVPLTFGPVPTASDRRSLAKAANCQLPTASWPSGTYFVHLLEGTRWLAGGKVVRE